MIDLDSDCKATIADVRLRVLTSSPTSFDVRILLPIRLPVRLRGVFGEYRFIEMLGLDSAQTQIKQTITDQFIKHIASVPAANIEEGLVRFFSPRKALKRSNGEFIEISACNFLFV